MLEYGDGLWPSIGHITVRLGTLPFVFVSVSCLLVFCDFVIGLIIIIIIY